MLECRQESLRPSAVHMNSRIPDEPSCTLSQQEQYVVCLAPETYHRTNIFGVREAAKPSPKKFSANKLHHHSLGQSLRVVTYCRTAPLNPLRIGNQRQQILLLDPFVSFPRNPDVLHLKYGIDRKRPPQGPCRYTNPFNKNRVGICNLYLRLRFGQPPGTAESSIPPALAGACVRSMRLAPS